MRRIVLLCAALAALLVACGGGGNSNSSTNTTTGSFPTRAAATVAPGGATAEARIVLARDQRLLLRDAAGKERLLVQTPPNTFPTYPVWSPDGKQVAYVQATLFTGQVNADYGGDVYLIAPGGQPKLLWKHDQQGAQIQGMDWTPDGQSLVVGYWLTIIKDNKFAGQVQRLSRIDVASGAMTTMFDGPMFPSFSDDGKTLAYMTQDLNGEGGLWVAGPDGSNPRELVELGPKFNAILYPRISPDGSTLVFSAVSAAQSSDPRQTAGGLNALHGAPMDVWRVNVADGTTQRITKLNEDEPYAAWTCDSKGLMIFATGGLYTLNADGSNIKKIDDGAFGGHIDIRC